MSIARPMLLTTALAIAVVGSSAAASSPAPSDPEAPSYTSDDVALSMELAGGFVPFEAYLLTLADFTLYSDGLVVYRPLPGPDDENLFHVPLRQVTLDQDELQELLAFALADGGLADAREYYDVVQIADATTTVFTINADGHDKRVEVYALGFEGADDPAARDAFEALARILADFDSWLPDDADTELFHPAAYFAVFAEDDPERRDLAPWPWSDLTPSDLVPVTKAPFFAAAILTPEQVELVTKVPSGGAADIGIATSTGEAYRLMIRPLLPDESLAEEG